MTTLEVLREVESYLDDRADINSDGGPDSAMQLLQVVREEIRRIAPVDYAKLTRESIGFGYRDLAYLYAMWAARDAFRACPELRG